MGVALAAMGTPAAQAHAPFPPPTFQPSSHNPLSPAVQCLGCFSPWDWQAQNSLSQGHTLSEDSPIQGRIRGKVKVSNGLF